VNDTEEKNTEVQLKQLATENCKLETTNYKLQTTNHKLQTALVPHAPYSVSAELWNLIQPFFSNKTISIHNQETSFEDELFIQNGGDFLRMYQLMKIDHSFFKSTGKSSLQSYFHKLSSAKNVILVHNTFTKEEDVLYVKNQIAELKQKVWFCICINTNIYIENKVPPIDMFVSNECPMVLGTDSLASTRSLNLLDEIKSVQQYFPTITIQHLLQWATINGAKALQMDDTLGSFEKGKRPGIVLIDNLSTQHLTAQSTAKRLL
jgi:aminodeoxyfutalosine deaminase